MLAELFPEGPPVPFEAVLDRLRDEAGIENVQAALVPLGRSLQRYAAHPDYFGSPRIVVAVTGDSAAGPAAPRLADRLFLGYAPSAEVIEAISYDEATGRFVFEEVVGYGGAGATIGPADPQVCLRCHQGAGPIFARPLWSETNANPEVAALLAPLGAAFHGVAVEQTVDGLQAFDAATDRAAEAAVANRLWAKGCGEPACRAMLLDAAARGALGGAPAAGPEAAAFERRAGGLWPDGLGAASPDLPNRDPLLQDDPTDLDATGALDPQTPRDPLVLWRPDDGFRGAARLVAAQFAAGDPKWIARLAARVMSVETLALDCEVGAGWFRCLGAGAEVSGLVDAAGAARLRRIAIDGQPPGRVVGDRLPDGRNARLTLADSRATLILGDDLAPLGPALTACAEAEAPALGDGPFRRRAVLAMIADCLEAANG